MSEEFLFSCDGEVAVICDGKCAKAFGSTTRPRVALDPDDEDDYCFLADDELGEAPADPGTYEADQGKPADYGDPGRHNKWCARECERSLFVWPIRPSRLVRLPDLSERLYNIPRK